MCGINGIISKNQNLELSEILRMNKVIEHRGPDDFGIIQFNNTILGHVRLSIQDLSLKGRQPMSRDGNEWIIYNGEIYNFREIRNELENKGYKFFSKTDTEVILAAFNHWGEKCLNKFNGMWVFALLDKKKKKIKICRDRYGVKPCYISKQNNKIIFSSEIKGILASNENFEIDKKTAFNVNDIIREKYFKTIFKNIDIIEPGHIYEIDLNNLEINKYRWWFGLNEIPQISRSKKNIRENIFDKLVEATKIRLISDVKIATSLSGGIDSSIIFSILNKFSESKFLDLNPFVLNYEGNKTFEAAIEFCKVLSKKPIIINSQESLRLDSFNNLESILSSLEITSTYFNQLELYKKQNEMGFKVSIDGHGADEALAGYTKFFPFLSMQFINYLSDSYEAIYNTKGSQDLQNKLQKYGLPKLKNKFLLNSNNYFINQEEKITNRYTSSSYDFEIPESFLKDQEILNEYDYDFQIQYLEATYGNLQWLLNKWDKASMAHSIEIRSPFLDWNFFQYCLAIPSHLKIENGKNKSILRASFHNYLPKIISEIKIKQGLPKQKEIFDNNLYKFINNTINEEDFIYHSSWDGKKVIKDFNNSEEKEKNKKNIWELVLVYLQEKGFKKRFKNFKKIDSKISEQYNFLKN